LRPWQSEESVALLLVGGAVGLALLGDATTYTYRAYELGMSAV
jgi:hypothetical protein